MGRFGLRQLGWLLCCAFAILPSAVHALAAAPPARIRVVADNNFPPYLFLDEDGKLQGYEADVWRLFEAHTGIAVDLEPMTWTAAQQAVQAGRADVIDMIFRTPSRAALYDFGAPFANVPTNIYADRKIHGLHHAASLQGFRVAVAQGDACAERLRSLGVTDLREFTSYRDIVQAAARGSVRVFCMGEAPAELFLYQYLIRDRFDPAFTFYIDPLGRAVRKGNASVLAAVEHGMTQITSAEYATLRKRWLAQPDAAGIDLRVAGIAAAVVVALLALLALWVWSLRRTVAARTHDLKNEAATLRAVFDASPDAMTVKDRHGRYIDCNRNAVRHFDIEREKLLGNSIADLSSPAVSDKVQALDEAVMRHGQPRTEQVSFVARTGTTRHYEITKVATSTATGVHDRILTVARDVTEQKAAEIELRLAAAAFEAQEGLMVLGADHTILRVNKAFSEITGYAPGEVLGKPSAMLVVKGDDPAFHRAKWARVTSLGSWQGEQWLQVKTGSPKAARVTLSAVTDAAGKASHFVCALVDLTKELADRASIDHMTFFDPLTDLPNRYFLNGRLQHMLDAATQTCGILLLIDLDHFKSINDLRGHATGDRLLTQIAQRLREQLDERCELCRFSGGTFALLEGGSQDPESLAGQARDCADRVRRILQEPFRIGDDVTTPLTVSMGWTRLLPGQGTPDSVLKEAELAMYAAKAAGRDQARSFDPIMQADLLHRADLTRDLRRAIADEALDMHLQPQVDRQGRITGAEVLLRWTRPNGEAVSPSVFIPVAEKSGLILQLGNWVLARTCALLATWSGKPETRELSLAVNVSARQFAEAGFVQGVQDLLTASGAPPTRLKLEITETTILVDLNETARKLALLRQQGLQISLDDFGTGYSSLAYLSRLPLDQLKIDQSFVARLPDDANDAMVAQTIISMGRGLNMKVIAEGVETEAQMHFLKTQGCDAFQGFLIAKPMPVAAFEAMLENRAQPG